MAEQSCNIHKTLLAFSVQHQFLKRQRKGWGDSPGSTVLALKHEDPNSRTCAKNKQNKSKHKKKLNMAVQTCNPNTRKVEM